MIDTNLAVEEVLENLGFNTGDLLDKHVDLEALLQRLDEGLPTATVQQALAADIDLAEFDARHGGDTLSDYEAALDQFCTDASSRTTAVTSED
ncbi:MAG: hypothetical protein K2W82_16825 [Candidatus Obscuribacterales bacterium]|nr:hypothetical protein [Candidatus Obscuribacterales bacterium]